MRQLYQFLTERFDGFFFVLTAVYLGLVFMVFAGSDFLIRFVIDVLNH